MSWIHLAQFKLEDLGGRFEAFEVSDTVDVAVCTELVTRVRQSELRRMAGESAFATSGFCEDSAEGILVAVRDRLRRRIVGCVRGIFGRSVAEQVQARREYRLDLLPAELLEHTGLAVRMVIEPHYRRSAASLELTRTLYQLSLRKYAMQLFCVSCEPALLGMYQRMGYRPLARVWAKPSGGFRVPTLLVGYDEEHLVRVDSPLLPRLREVPRPWPEQGVRWFRTLAPSLPTEIGVRPWDSRASHPALRGLTAGMSEDGRRELLTNAVEVEAQPGDLAFCEGDGVRALAVVLDGAIEARREGKRLARLGACGVLGAVTTTLDRDRQANIVVVEPATRLLLLSRSATQRIRSPHDRAALWRNLAWLLAERVVEVADSSLAAGAGS